MSLFKTGWQSTTGRACLWAWGLVFVTCGYFYNTMPGDIANTQFALTSAIVDQGTLCIDDYHEDPQFKTGDKAFFAGHYYSDKSPVNAFLGVPVLGAYRLLTRVLGMEPNVADGRYWTTWLTDGLAASLVAALTAFMLIQRGVAPKWAAWAAGLWAVATPLLGYSTVFFNYAPACALALGGFLLLAPLWRGAMTGNERGRLVGGGLLLGLAAWTLNTLAVIALVVSVGAVLAPVPHGVRGAGRWRARLGRLWPLALGGLIGVAGYFIYSYSIFHSFASPYAYEANPYLRSEMARGLMGATWPKPLVAILITFHPFEGMFFWYPLATLALIGLIALLTQGKAADRREAWMALAIFVLLLTYNSAYYMWWGGWAYVPRHLIPVLTLMSVGLQPWLVTSNARLPRWLLAIGLAGAVISLAALAFNPQHSAKLPGDIMRELRAVSHWPSPMMNAQRCFWTRGFLQNPNWGTMLGFSGRASLLPLAAFGAAAFALSGRLFGARPTDMESQ